MRCAIPVANRSQRGVNLPAAPAFPNDRLQLLFRRRADRQLGSVVEQNPSARARCRRSCRRAASACRTSCCRSSRRGCSGCVSTDPARMSAGGARRVLEAYPGSTPGWTRAMRFSISTSRMRFMYFVKSSTTATLQLWPARLVPEPRASIGASNDLHTATAARTSSSSRGTTTPMGTCR